jgi:hypothetical protein
MPAMIRLLMPGKPRSGIVWKSGCRTRGNENRERKDDRPRNQELLIALGLLLL